MDQKYTIEGFDVFLDELLDKMGSDYFPLPIKFNRFITISLDFVAESAVYEEINQEVSDFIKPLRVEGLYPLNNRDGFLYCPEPVNYFRLSHIVPLYEIEKGENAVRARHVNIERQGNQLSNSSNPFKRPTEEYPEVTRINEFFKIDIGNPAGIENYKFCFLKYIKKPTFGDISNLTDRIINLPDDSIEKIYLKTADSLRVTTADPNSPNSYAFTQTFGKKNK